MKTTVLEDKLFKIFQQNLAKRWEDSLVAESEAWQKKSGKNKNGGLNAKGVKSYRASHPGSHLQTAVTTKPSKLKKGSKASKRRASFCARMKGMKKSRTSSKTAHDPNSRINKSLRKWHCESLQELLVTARQHIYEAEGDAQGLKHLTPHLAKDILDQIETEGIHAIVKSIEWGDGGAKELVDLIKRELKKVAGKSDADSIKEGYGTYWCSTDKKWKQRKGPKQSRNVGERMQPDSAFTGSKKNKINGKGMLKANAKFAKAGDLVGGS